MLFTVGMCCLQSVCVAYSRYVLFTVGMFTVGMCF